MTGIVIGRDDPTAPDVAALITAHLVFAHEVTPVEHIHAMAPARLGAEDITFFSARRDGTVVCVGALKALDDEHGEIKSMHTVATARGQGVGRAMVRHLMVEATNRGWRRLSLETGTMEAFAPARSLYRSLGFVPCAPFADYSENPYSLCMTLELD